MPKVTTVTDLRSKLADYLKDLEGAPLQVLQHSKPAAYILAAKDFEKIIEQLEDLEDIVDGMATLREILEDPDLVVDAEEVFEKLGL